MKRASRITSEAYHHRSELLFHGKSSKPTTPTTRLKPYPQPTFRFSRPISDQTFPSPPPNNNPSFHRLIPMFSDPSSTSSFSDRILACNGDSAGIVRVLDDNILPLIRVFPDGSAFVELLELLRSSPLIALQVFDWRRKLADPGLPMTAEEYSKGITITGKAKNVKLATELFQEADYKRIKTASTYNALMSAYMVNGMTDKCESLLRIYKNEEYCSPTVVTYNTLICSFGGKLMVKEMKAALEEIKELNLTPTLKTFNNLIKGYVIAWKWDDMEKTYWDMKASSVQPDTDTYLLMLRGYSHSCNLAKMEEMYELLKQSDSDCAKEVGTVINMICGYCKHSDPSRISKIEELMKLIPEENYTPWLNVLLIKTYAMEGLVDKMEASIEEAFERQTSVGAIGIMRAIITTFFNCNAVDKLAEFVSRAESAGWKLCRSLYHCKMVMYASHNRLTEMENVLSEMERVNLDHTKKTLVILYKAYLRWGPKYRVRQLQGIMCKRGYEIPPEECPS